MKNLNDKVLNYKIKQHPLKTIYWKDKDSTAIGWIVIDTLVNGIAGGGLFMHPNATLEEVKELAQSMTYKNFVITTPQIGGAKGGIKFDPEHPDANNVLTRFLKDHKGIIENIWCTGGDLNTTNEGIEAIVRENLNLPTAFVCLAKAMYKYEQIPDASMHMSSRIATPVNEFFNIGQCATGYSVCTAIQAVTDKMPRVIIQGFGKVGSSLAFFLQTLGVGLVVGICEKDGFIYNSKGIDVIPLVQAKITSEYNSLFPLKSLLDTEQASYYNWTSASNNTEETLIELFNRVDADVLSPCAARYTITKEAVKNFVNGTTTKFIVSGANNPFQSVDMTEICLQSNVIVIPDWVSNAGNAILFVETLRYLNWDLNAVNKMLDLIANCVQKFIKEAKLRHVSQGISLFESCYQIGEERRLRLEK